MKDKKTKQSQKGKPKFPWKLKFGKKSIYRRIKPIIVMAYISTLTILTLLVIFVVKYLDDFSLMFAIAIVAAVIPLIAHIFDKTDKSNEYLTSHFARIEKIKLDKRKFNVTLKNIGTSNIFWATIYYIRNNGQPIAENITVNFFPTSEIITLTHNHKLKLDSIRKLEYAILIPIGNTMVALSYEQRMELIDGEYVIENNACELRRRLYYKWLI